MRPLCHLPVDDQFWLFLMSLQPSLHSASTVSARHGALLAVMWQVLLSVHVPANPVGAWAACPPASRMLSAVCMSLGLCRAVCGCRKMGVPGRALWGAELGWAATAAPSSRAWETWRLPPALAAAQGYSLLFPLPAGCMHHDSRLPALLLPLLLLLGAH